MLNNIKEKIVGLKYLVNNEYQKKVEENANSILQDKKEINVESFMKASIFNQVNDEQKSFLEKRINEIAGNDQSLNKTELKTVLCLLDAELKSGKFEMDSNIDINENSGVFQALPSEIKSLMNIVANYDYEDLAKQAFFTLNENNTLDGYNRDDEKIMTIHPDGKMDLYKDGEMVKSFYPEK